MRYLFTYLLAPTIIIWNTPTRYHRCQPARIRSDSPAFSSDVPRPAKSDRCPAFLENCIIIFSLPIILHVCLETQQSDELRIKIGSKFARRQDTDYKYTAVYYTRGSRRQRLFIFIFLTQPHPPVASTLLLTVVNVNCMCIHPVDHSAVSRQTCSSLNMLYRI